MLLGHLFALLLPGGLLLWNSVPIRLYLLEATGLALGLWALVGPGDSALAAVERKTRARGHHANGSGRPGAAADLSGHRSVDRHGVPLRLVLVHGDLYALLAGPWRSFSRRSAWLPRCRG